MKKIISSLLLLFTCFNLHAQETTHLLELGRGIVVHVVNGEAVENGVFNDNNQLILNQAENQLLLTLEQPIPYNTMKEKYRSNLIVLTFELTSSNATLSYPLFRDKADARAFEQELNFEFIDTEKSSIRFVADTIATTGFVGFEDFVGILKEYNRKQQEQ
ncbi:DUF2057 family protein [Vibrio nomapromontoriensis]|uniref:DUF2057 family protein n=1 Tax=Vibrio nomapromontoriensis TaxID=2910246 RepID=UPI003D0E5539